MSRLPRRSSSLTLFRQSSFPPSSRTSGKRQQRSRSSHPVPPAAPATWMTRGEQLPWSRRVGFILQIGTLDVATARKTTMSTIRYWLLLFFNVNIFFLLLLFFLVNNELGDFQHSMEMEVDESDAVSDRKSEEEKDHRILPPTPPSSSSSDSEGTISASCSPERRDFQSHGQNLRGLLNPRLYVTNAPLTTRQPINTPLISCQPVGWFYTN